MRACASVEEQIGSLIEFLFLETRAYYVVDGIRNGSILKEHVGKEEIVVALIMRFGHWVWKHLAVWAEFEKAIYVLQYEEPLC